MRVDIAHGYSGLVMIECGNRGDVYQTIAVDSTGRIRNVTCPSRPTELLIMRDGRRISTLGPINWKTTGDEIPLSIQFTIPLMARTHCIASLLRDGKELSGGVVHFGGFGLALSDN